MNYLASQFPSNSQNLFSYFSSRKFPKAIRNRQMFDSKVGRYIGDIIKWNKCSYLFVLNKKEFQNKFERLLLWFFALWTVEYGVKLVDWSSILADNEAPLNHFTWFSLFLIFKNVKIRPFANFLSEPKLYKRNKQHSACGLQSSETMMFVQIGSLPSTDPRLSIKSSGFHACGPSQWRIPVTNTWGQEISCISKICSKLYYASEFL